MDWKSEYSPDVIRQLNKLDQPIRRRIFRYLEEHIHQCKNPRHFGEALTANRAKFWRYRVGDYRIICDILEEKVIILILTIGHRREIYK